MAGDSSERSARDIIVRRQAGTGRSVAVDGGDVKAIAKHLESVPLEAEEPQTQPEPVNAPEPEPQGTDEPTQDTPGSALRVSAAKTPAPAEEPEPQPETEPEPEATPEPAREPEPTHEVGRYLRLPDGSKQWVTVDEAFAGYLRQKDYTQKRQADADKSRRLDSLIAEQAKLRDHYAALLQDLEETLNSVVPQEPNWAELRRTLPAQQYLEQREQWDAFDKNRNSVKAERERVAKKQQEDFATQRQQVTERETQALVSALPAWTDDETYAAEYAAMVRKAKALGFTREEVDGTVDHRLLLMLHEATFGRGRQSNNQPAPTRTAPERPRKPGVIRTIAPGSALDRVPRPSEKDEPRRANRDRLRKTGKQSDAVPVFEDLIDAGIVK